MEGMRRTRRVLAVCAMTMIAVGSVSATASAAPAPSAWKVVATPDLGAHTALHAVACPAADTCFAVGAAEHGTTTDSVIARWDGKSWTRMTHPRLGRDVLFGVACFSATRCVAVGRYSSFSNVATLVETWDGTRWSMTPSPNPSWFGNELVSASCVSALRCTAVGDDTDMHDDAYPIAEQWNGFDWEAQPAPYSGFVDDNTLAGVSCPTETRCTAVGSTVDSHGQRVLVEQWNGKQWTLQPVVQTDSTDRSLASIGCSAGARCVAVGRVGDRALVERRSPTGWTTEPGAAVDEATAALAGVTCVGSTRCVAVGGAGADAAHEQPLIETAQGSTWSLVTSPVVDGQPAVLQGVACATAVRCFAVGAVGTGGHASPLILSGSS